MKDKPINFVRLQKVLWEVGVSVESDNGAALRLEDFHTGHRVGVWKAG